MAKQPPVARCGAEPTQARADRTAVLRPGSPGRCGCVLAGKGHAGKPGAEGSGGDGYGNRLSEADLTLRRDPADGAARAGPGRAWPGRLRAGRHLLTRVLCEEGLDERVLLPAAPASRWPRRLPSDHGPDLSALVTENAWATRRNRQVNAMSTDFAEGLLSDRAGQPVEYRASRGTRSPSGTL